MLPCGHGPSGPARGAVGRVAGRRTGVRELLRKGTTHGRHAKIGNAGRHALAKPRHVRPGQLNKLVKRAALVAPAVAAAGAVVAAVTAQGQASPAPADAAGRVTAGSAQTRHSGRHANLSSGHPKRSPSSNTASALRTARSRAAKPGGTASAAQRSGSPSPAATSRPQALHCSGSSVMLPGNYVAIVSFLTAHGYTKLAAAGIAGNMYQESKGNPESVGSGGGGLIGWTPLPGGFVTGNPAADLQAQLAAILTFNQQWAQYIPALNAATTPAEAADIYVTDFERAGIPAAANREAA